MTLKALAALALAVTVSALGAATVPLAAADPARAASPNDPAQRQIRKLKRQLQAARASRQRWLRRAEIAEVEADVADGKTFAAEGNLKLVTTTLTAERDTARRERDVAVGQRDAAQAENQQLKGELPARVAAVAREDNLRQLFDLVIIPAHDNWSCRGSMFFGETFWSVDFDRRTSRGDCY